MMMHEDTVAPAPMSDGEVRKAAIDPERSFLVEAPAGSGKTELLIQRILRLLTTVSQPEEIVGITFTRKAAAEMRDRVIQAMTDAALHVHAALSGEDARAREIEEKYVPATLELAREAVAHDRQQDWNLLKTPGRLRIQTIDSFHGYLVRQLPFLSHSGGFGGITDKAEELYRAAVRSMLDQATSNETVQAHLHRLLIHLDNNRDLFESMFMALLATREKWIDIFERGQFNPKAMLDALEDALEHALLDALRLTDSFVPSDLRDELAALAHYAASCLHEQDDEAMPGAMVPWIDHTSMPRVRTEDRLLWEGLAMMLLTNDGEYRKVVNKRNGFPPGGRAATEMKSRIMVVLGRLYDSEGFKAQMHQLRGLPDIRYEAWEYAVLESILALVQELLSALTTQFRLRDVCDHAFIAESARKAIGSPDDPTDLMLALDYQIRHILVDEFQDTSITQKRMLDTLTAGWSEGDGRTIFLVGDPMQSIYRFREADVSLFIQLKQRGFDSVRLRHLRLRKNFRSQTELVDWFNQAFPGVFPAEDDLSSGAIAYQSTDPTRPTFLSPAVEMVPCIDDVTPGEAEEVLRIIRELRSRPHPDPTRTGLWNPVIAILFRSRSHIAKIVQCLHQGGIRFQAVDVNALSNRQEVLDLVALTRAILHPADRLSWLAILRAPWCGLRLSDLHALTHSDSRTVVPVLLRQADRLAALSPDALLRVQRIAPILDRWSNRVGRRPVRRLIEGAWQELGGPATVDAEGLRNAAMYFDVLTELDDGGTVASFKTLDERVAGLYAQPDPDADAHIQMMSIHKAKGLQFDVVIIPGIGKWLPHDRQKLFVFDRRLRQDQPDDILFSVLSARGSDKTRTYANILQRNSRKDEFELSRLVYVALTRARYQVYLLGFPTITRGTASKAPALSLRKDTFVKKLWEVPTIQNPINEIFARYRTEAATQGPAGGHLPAAPGNMLRRLRSDWRTPDPPSRVFTATSTSFSSAREFREQHTSLFHAGDLSRITGIVTHRLLQVIATEGLAAWTTDRVAACHDGILRFLQEEGMTESEVPSGVEQVRQSLVNALSDARGRWILDAHREHATELAITTMVDGVPVRMIIDRTFLDDEGIRWIIDYKSGLPDASGPEAFIEAKSAEYADQLYRYATAMSQLWRETIRVGLYFPSIPAWRELPLDIPVSPAG